MPHVLVYKEGDSHVIRGVKCEFARIKISEIDLYLSKGYVKDPQELLEEVEVSELYTFDQLNDLHYKKVDAIAVDLGLSTEGDKQETIKLILEAQ